MKQISAWILAFALPLVCCAHSPPPPPSTAPTEVGGPQHDPPQQKRLRVVTYNVHFGQDVAGIADCLRKNPETRQADVLLLQEIRSYPREGTSRASRLAEALGMRYVYAPAHPTKDGGTHGLAMLSRFPLRDPRVLELPPFKIGGSVERRIALSATLDVGGQEVRVYNVHLDTRLDPADRAIQLGPVIAAAAAEPAVLLGGDFNTNPFRWLRRTLPIARSKQPQALDAVMQRAGYSTPTAALVSTVTTRLLRMRLDAIYLRGLEGGAAGVERTVRASDHVPVWLDVGLPAGG